MRGCALALMISCWGQTPVSNFSSPGPPPSGLVCQHVKDRLQLVCDAKVQRNFEPHNSSHADSESIRKSRYTIRKELRKNG
jgi:hypothetical protein